MARKREAIGALAAGLLSCESIAAIEVRPRIAQIRATRSGENEMTIAITRRQTLFAGAAAVAAAALGQSMVPAFAANNLDEMAKKFTGGAAAVEGKVKLDLPEIAENGNTVPITVSVDSPMTDADYVSEVIVLADGNPNAGIATFHFTPASGVAEANTRIRLAGTQNIVAIAKTKDGKFYTAKKQVKVTIGGCGG
jgi:sulfur-oxidizing protein SoxY